MTDPIRKTLTVPLTAAEAFDLFTAGIDRWWPKETHSLAAANDTGAKTRVRVEPREGGRIIETLPDGTEAPWATITGWRPGERFAMRWYVGRTPEEATDVDIRFTQTEAGTRVDLTHSGWQVHGAKSGELSENYRKGWDHVLGVCYGGHCARVAA